MNDPLVFKISEASLSERRLLLRDLRIGLGLLLGLLCMALGNAPLPVQSIAWLLSGLLFWAIWRLDGEGLIAPVASRELRLQDSALEIVQGRFTRLLFFTQLEQLRMIQGKDEKVRAIELQTLEGGVLLSGYENMATLFTGLSTRKPDKVLIEVEEQGFDRNSILAWRKVAYIAGGVLLLLLLLVSPSDATLKKLSGLLLIALAAFVAIYQPFSHRKGKKAALAEVGMGLVFMLFGLLFLM